MDSRLRYSVIIVSTFFLGKYSCKCQSFSAEAQQQVRSLHQENISLKKQICDNHLNFVEKSSKLEKQVKSVEYLSKEAQVSLRSAVFSLGKYMYPCCNKPAAQVFTIRWRL